MNIHTAKPYVWIYGLPFLIFLTSALLALSTLPERYPDLAIGITYDLTLTAPLLYLFLIRKRKIPNITAVPLFVIGLVLATLLLPESRHDHLDLIKTYLLPVVEITVLFVISYKVLKAIRDFKRHSGETADFYSTLKKSAAETLGHPKVANVFAAEIAMLYYGLFSWRRRIPLKDEFTSHKESGVMALFIAIIAVVLIETVAVHVLLLKWNAVIAWIVTLSSIYAALQLLGHIKAMRRRYSTIKNDRIVLKYGLFGEATITLDAIEKVILTTKDIDISDKKVEKLALLAMMESHNIALYFKEPQRFEKAYGIVRKCDVLLLHIDNKEAFADAIKNAMQDRKL